MSAHDDAASRHVPVLLERCLDLLAPPITQAAQAGRTPVMIDCTLGMGGHTHGALSRFPDLHVIGIDRDPQAIALATVRLAPFGERFTAVQATYDQVDQVARDYAAPSCGGVDAILMDLGVSSLQLDEAERGFSYARSAPLDMRMDQSSGRTAQDILDQEDAPTIARILRLYGEERFASKIAARIVSLRQAGTPVRDTSDLVEVVRSSIPAAARRTGGNPAKRTFQALRVAVNAELDVLEAALPAALNALRVGGHLVIESYQSLEDRLVKQAFVAGTRSRAPEGLPFIPEADQPYLEALTHGAERATQADIEDNPRSAPVRLRAVRRVRSAQDAPAPSLGSSSDHDGAPTASRFTRGSDSGGHRPQPQGGSRARRGGSGRGYGQHSTSSGTKRQGRTRS